MRGGSFIQQEEKKILLLAEFSGDCENVDRGKSHESVNDLRKRRHRAEEGVNEVPVEQAHESPVKTADDHENKCEPVESAKLFHDCIGS